VTEPLEHRTVSRKTARDGKHEVSADTAARLWALGLPFDVLIDGVPDRGTLVRMPCTCRPEAHEHWFIEANALRTLEAGREATIGVTADGRMVEIRSSPSR
jgi:hypothetical protein